MAAETTFTIVYDGPAVESGRMEVRELAPSLLALGDLFREANALVSPDSSPVSLHITATSAGSFEVGLLLAQPDVIDRLVDLFSGDQLSALVNLKELIIGGPALSAGLIAIIKRLRGRRITNRERARDGVIIITLDDGTTVEVPSQVLDLYGSVQVRRSARDVVRPLIRPGVERIWFRTQQQQVTVTVEQGDIEAFEVPEQPEVPLLEQRYEMNLSIASVAFAEGNKWRLSDGERTFFARIEDGDFLDRVDRGEEAFRKGDILRCALHVTQSRNEGGLSTAYEVVRVLEHIPANRPINLSLFGNEPDNIDPDPPQGQGRTA